MYVHKKAAGFMYSELPILGKDILDIYKYIISKRFGQTALVAID